MTDSSDSTTRDTAARPCPNCGALVTLEQAHACVTQRCVGVAGRIFGHKYQDMLGRVGLFCLRCGKAAEISEGTAEDA